MLLSFPQKEIEHILSSSVVLLMTAKSQLSTSSIFHEKFLVQKKNHANFFYVSVTCCMGQFFRPIRNPMRILFEVIFVSTSANKFKRQNPIWKWILNKDVYFRGNSWPWSKCSSRDLAGNLLKAIGLLRNYIPDLPDFSCLVLPEVELFAFSDYFDEVCPCVHAEILSCETATLEFDQGENAGHLVLTRRQQFNRYRHGACINQCFVRHELGQTSLPALWKCVKLNLGWLCWRTSFMMGTQPHVWQNIHPEFVDWYICHSRDGYVHYRGRGEQWSAGKACPTGEENCNGSIGNTPQPNDCPEWGGSTTSAIHNPLNQGGWASDHGMAWWSMKPVWCCYHITVWHQGGDPKGVPLPGSDWKLEAPNQWCNALCITWQWTYDINKGESYDYLL